MILDLIRIWLDFGPPRLHRTSYGFVGPRILGFYQDSTRILPGFYQDSGVLGGPRRSEEVLGGPRRA